MAEKLGRTSIWEFGPCMFALRQNCSLEGRRLLEMGRWEVTICAEGRGDFLSTFYELLLSIHVWVSFVKLSHSTARPCQHGPRERGRNDLLDHFCLAASVEWPWIIPRTIVSYIHITPRPPKNKPPNNVRSVRAQYLVLLISCNCE